MRRFFGALLVLLAQSAHAEESQPLGFSEVVVWYCEDGYRWQQFAYEVSADGRLSLLDEPDVEGRRSTIWNSTANRYDPIDTLVDGSTVYRFVDATLTTLDESGALHSTVCVEPVSLLDVLNQDEVIDALSQIGPRLLEMASVVRDARRMAELERRNALLSEQVDALRRRLALAEGSPADN
ncbi:hypothetical protein HKCCSP123_00860 [Rhodobacterales bacterium HKCCSP123]|nr:hypothetical protein [Rhodobacterales bacterium HKCCSP123]